MQRSNMQKSKGRYKGYFVALAIIKLKRRSKKSKHRRYVLQQWLQTERSYQQDLSLAINHIKKPLLAKQLIDHNGGITLCTAFEQMEALSMEMLTTISVVEKQKNMNLIVIGPQLIKFASFYKLTSDYFGNRTKCEKLLKSLFQEHNSQMRHIQAQFQQAAKKIDIRKQYMTMAGCIQQPQYRMFKYGLLLKQYIKKMPTWHKDYKEIKKAIDVFEEISLNNNDKMARNQLAEKKIKLNQFAGRALDSQSEFRVEMTANSLYFPVKLYIFNNLIIVTKVQRILSFQEQRKYLSIYLNEFCYVKQKPDGKYYKNGLIICGMYQSLHLFTEEAGSRLQIVRAIEKVIHELQINAASRRKKNKVSENNKVSFALNFNKQLIFAPELRVEVLQTQVRPLGRLTNDTVYLTRFAAPLWCEDLALLGLPEDRLHIGQWQLIQVHLSRVMELYQTLCKEYPHIEFPRVDPLTKQMNVYTENKKKTIMFEQRSFLFEEFFNYILRNPTVMKNPMQIIHKHKFLAPFWEYLIKKNDYLAGRDEPEKDPSNYMYSGTHCQLCASVMRSSFESLQKLRQQASLCGQQMLHCFNASNLVRLKLVAEPQKKFDTVDRILLRQLHEAGRIDYAMLPRDQLNKRYQQVTIMNCAETIQQTVLIDYRRKVGEVMLDIGAYIGLDQALDCRLVLRYEGKQRILDQDQVLFDLINRYKFPVVERQDASRHSRFSYNVTTIQKEQSVFNFFQEVFSSKVDSSLAVRKIVYLPKELQIKVIMDNTRRGKYIIDELFGRLAKGQIPLEPDDYAEACSFWLLLYKYNELKNSPITHLMSLSTDKLIPPQRHSITHEKSFLKVFGDMIDKARKRPHGLSQKQIPGFYRTIIRIFYRCVKTYTYLTMFTVHTLPEQLITDGLGPIQGECYLGVNFKELLVFRRIDSPHPAVKLSLQDIKITCSTFSLFLTYSAQLASNVHEYNIEARQLSLRFDGRLLYHFRYMVELYLNLRKIFPNTII